MDSKGDQQLDDRERFDKAFSGLVEDLVKGDEDDREIGDAVKRLREVVEYNVPGGKRNRGLSVIGSLRHLVGPDELKDEDIKTAVILGWCVEMLQAFFLVADDIMDQSLMRRGQVCWYKKDSIGNIAINDSFSMESAMYRLLRKHLCHKSYYTDVLDLFHEVTYSTVIGQSLDLTTTPGENFEHFTLDRYKAIVKYKTAFYSFYLPVALAMFMVGIKDQEAHENAKVILLDMGEFFQIQDDYLDCYGDPKVTGKVGTDIEECKCSWLVIQALQRVSDEQLQFLKAHYGVRDTASSDKVKALYKELHLKEVYQEHEEESYQRILKLIHEHSQNLPKEVFLNFVRKIYKRNK